MTNQDLPANKIKAVEALASGATNEQAAKEADVTIRTLFRWKGQPDFAAELRRVNSEKLEAATLQLTSLLPNVILHLYSIGRDPDVAVTARVSALSTILSNALKLREHYSIEARLDELERRLEERVAANGKVG